jgi:NAD(P)-dependent dehydrogenase (short-subunit alcohol dehydrogenase family)
VPLSPLSREIRTGLRPPTFAGDISDSSGCQVLVDDAAAALGGLDILVNNVPAPVFGPFLGHGDHQWEEAMRLKFHAYVRTSRCAVPHLARSAGGVIVNIIGVGGKVVKEDHLAGGSANAALMLLTTGLAKELGTRGIRVVGVSPGSTQTARHDAHVLEIATETHESVETVEERLVATTPTGRLSLPQDIADVVAFLASARARQVNGTTVTVDGGAMQAV